MSAFFGEAEPDLQKAFANAFHISEAELISAAKILPRIQARAIRWPRERRWFRLGAAIQNSLFPNTASQLGTKIIVDSWTFGGGTAMMIQIDHRESHDVDIFLPDPQLLPYIDPRRTNSFLKSSQPDYSGDGHGFLKIAFDGVGEIDFIVGNAMKQSDDPTNN